MNCHEQPKCSLCTADDPPGLSFSALICRRYCNAIPLEQTAIVTTIRPLGQVLNTDWCADNYVLVRDKGEWPNSIGRIPCELDDFSSNSRFGFMFAILAHAVHATQLFWQSYLVRPLSRSTMVLYSLCLLLLKVHVVAVQIVQCGIVADPTRRFHWSLWSLARKHWVLATYIFTSSVMWYLVLSQFQ